MSDSNSSYRFKMGDFECVVVSDGILTLPGGGPPPGSGQRNAPAGTKMDVMSLYIKTGKHNVLIDTGFGAGGMTGTGKLLSSLQAAGIEPAEIDTIIHTHLHTDHIGGNVDAAGKPIYPNARHFLHKADWDFWSAKLGQKDIPPGLIAMTVEMVRKNLLPIKDRLQIVDGEPEVVPGIRIGLAPGHTPGNITIALSSGSGRLLNIGDLLHLPVEYTQPDLYQMLDIDHKQTVLTRNRVSGQAAASGVLVFASHFPFPGVGHIVQKDGVFQWKPIG